MDNSSPASVLVALKELRESVAEEGQTSFNRWESLIKRPSFSTSALNLAHYLALRRQDLRPMQVALMPWGLSSLGRIESRVMQNLNVVISTLEYLCQPQADYCDARPSIESFFEGERILRKNIEDLFGKRQNRQRARIMVTLPSEAATDYSLVYDLLKRGADCVRINCAHDSADAWEEMINHVRQAELVIHRSCKIFMDLAGAKPRVISVAGPDLRRRLFVGDHILLVPEIKTKSSELAFFQAACSLPEVLKTLKPGASVWIDDGKIGAKVDSVTAESVILKVTNARPKGERLRADKGLNFPDSKISLAPLTEKDLKDLDFIAAHADIVGYSFVQKTSDIQSLQKELESRLGKRAQKIAIVIKTETDLCIKNLPELIVHAAGKQPLGVMIARGDLAIEIGYQRLAEIQEEILWLCEAAHVPVIWATQVLETLVKGGTPSRAEITDAAMAQRADCVMLNKGPFVADAISILDDVLVRMHAHHTKKTPQLRALRSW